MTSLFFLSVALLFGVPFAFAESTAEDSPTLDPLRIYGESGPSGDSLEVPERLITPEPFSSGSLPRLLKYEPSVVGRESGGESSEVGLQIRGQDPVQTRYFIEGVPVTDAAYNASSVTALPLELVSQVALYPQAPPVKLATDGLGGAIDLSLADSERRAAAEWLFRGGGFGYRRGFVSVRMTEPIGSLFAVDYAESQENFDFFSDNGTPFNPNDDAIQPRQNNSFSRISGLIHSQLYESPRTALRFFGWGGYRRWDVPGPTSAPTNSKLKRYEGLLGVKANFFRSAKGEWEKTFYARLESDELTEEQNSAAVRPAKTKQYSWGTRSQATLRLAPEFRTGVVLGAKWDQYQRTLWDGGAERAPTREPSKTRWSVPLGFWGEWVPTPSLTIAPGLQGEYFQYELDGTVDLQNLLPQAEATRSHFLISPRLGAKYRFNSEWSLQGLAGFFQRAPTLYELYGRAGSVSPAPLLSPEKAWKADAELSWRKYFGEGPIREIQASGVYFISRASSLISYVDNGPSTLIATNVGGALIHGQEATLSMLSRWDINLRWGASLLWTENLAEAAYAVGKELPGRPPYRLAGRLAWEPSRWELSYGVAWVGPQYWDLSNTKRMDATSEHAITMGWRSAVWGEWLVEVRNVWDSISATSRYGDVISVDNTTGFFGYPAPGRRWFLSWRYSL